MLPCQQGFLKANLWLWVAELACCAPYFIFFLLSSKVINTGKYLFNFYRLLVAFLFVFLNILAKEGHAVRQVKFISDLWAEHFWLNWKCQQSNVIQHLDSERKTLQKKNIFWRSGVVVTNQSYFSISTENCIRISF